MLPYSSVINHWDILLLCVLLFLLEWALVKEIDWGYCGYVADEIASKTLNRWIEILKLISLDIVNYLSIVNYTINFIILNWMESDNKGLLSWLAILHATLIPGVCHSFYACGLSFPPHGLSHPTRVGYLGAKLPVPRPAYKKKKKRKQQGEKLPPDKSLLSPLFWRYEMIVIIKLR